MMPTGAYLVKANSLLTVLYIFRPNPVLIVTALSAARAIASLFMIAISAVIAPLSELHLASRVIRLVKIFSAKFGYLWSTSRYRILSSARYQPCPCRAYCSAASFYPSTTYGESITQESLHPVCLGERRMGIRHSHRINRRFHLEVRTGRLREG